MKTKLLLTAAALGLAAFTAKAGDEIRVITPSAPVTATVSPAPVVVAQPTTTMVVPDSYIWDGSEKVGYVNGSYFYLSGDTWLPLSSDKVERFHAYEMAHPDWREHAIRNEVRKEMREERDRERDHDKDRDGDQHKD